VDVLGPGNHGTTFGGNPLAMRAGVETLRIMVEDGLLAHAAEVGALLKAGLEQALAAELASGGVKEIRGAGLMIGVELARPCGVLIARAAEAGLMISVTADSVIRIVPPLIISADEARQLVALLAPLVRAFLAEPA
jgi:acetylornithine aminotransferase